MSKVNRHLRKYNLFGVNSITISLNEDSGLGGAGDMSIATVARCAEMVDGAR
jgi:hypothetical protein